MNNRYSFTYSGDEIQEMLDWINTNKISIALIEDLGSSVFTPEENFTVEMQHFYRIGGIVFGHIVFHRDFAVTSTALYKIGSTSIKALHNHQFAAAYFNTNTGTAGGTDFATVETNGDIRVRLTATYSTSNYTWDLSFFFCENE